MNLKRHDYNLQEPISDPRLALAAAELQRKVKSFVFFKTPTPLLLADVQEMVNSESRRYRREQGLDFPDLTVLWLMRVGHIALLRRDLDEASVRQTIVNVTREFPSVTSMELAQAVFRAFPEYAKKVVN